MATSWLDQEAYADIRFTAPPLSPGDRRLAEALTLQADETTYPGTLFDDSLTYWQAHDRREGRPPREWTRFRDDVVALYLLGRQDMALTVDDAEADRPSGVLALATGTLFGLAVCAALFATGLVLGAVRWGW